MATGRDRRERLDAARLYLVIEAAPARAIVSAVLAGGVDVVQLRDKEAGDGELVAAGRELRGACEAAGALLVVNDRVEVALACGAHGVHVGQEDEPPAAVRAAVGPDVLIGLSTHSPEQIAAAEHSEADYLGVGPVYETATKPGVAPVGLELVRHAATHASKPWFAIGGIDAGRAGAVAEAGARRIAVVRAIRDAHDPGAAARELREAIEIEAGVGQAQ